MNWKQIPKIIASHPKFCWRLEIVEAECWNSSLPGWFACRVYFPSLFTWTIIVHQYWHALAVIYAQQWLVTRSRTKISFPPSLIPMTSAVTSTRVQEQIPPLSILFSSLCNIAAQAKDAFPLCPSCLTTHSWPVSSADRGQTVISTLRVFKDEIKAENMKRRSSEDNTLTGVFFGCWLGGASEWHSELDPVPRCGRSL